MIDRYYIFIIFLAVFTQGSIAKAATDTFLIHTDLPAITNEEKLILDVFYSSDSAFKDALSIRFYKYDGDDSTLVLSREDIKFPFRKGVNKTRIDFSKDDTNTYYALKFYEILKRTGSVPPGTYKAFITATHNGKAFRMAYLHEIDSLLSPSSPVRRDINKSLLPKQKTFLGIRLQKTLSHTASSGAGAALANMRNKADKAVKKRGLTSVHRQINGKSYIDLYYQDWFAGRYEVQNKGSLSGQIKLEDDLAHTTNFSSVTTNTMGSPSLFSQYKALNKNKKDKDEIKGEISVNTNVSSGQEQYSDVDNNYVEVRGMVELPIMGIPMEVEGLYTTQDAHREIKSSYFRVHYNVDKMKEDLSKSISSYNTKFSETKSKSAGMTQVYQTAITKLEGQRSKLQSEIQAEAGTGGMSGAAGKGIAGDIALDAKNEAKDTTGLKQELPTHTDSSGTADTSGHSGPSAKEKAEKTKAQAEAKKKRIEDKRRQVEELDKKIKKYELLLAQYKNTSYFDSTLGYAKTKQAASYSNMSYKQMAKSGSSLLPDGQAKGFIAGLTTLDAGMFPKYESKYTMSGQMMKGIDVGYDLGFSEVGATVGKTEYVGRDGSLDKYTCYSGRASFKPAQDQKISLLYYGYTADHKMYAGDGFFSNVNISAPGFFQPVHIVSMNYDGMASKYVKIGAEAASSFKGSDKTDAPPVPQDEKMAYHLSAEGNIPNSTISLEAAYDKTGKGFENNTLPVSMSGTEQYKLAGRFDFFRSFLTLGVEFDRLVQYSFATNGTNTKWGFDVKTNSKRYPNVAFSYKPFTTFQSYTDTLNIPQRPLIGSVTTGKATYQFKKHSRSFRFLVLYNKSETTMDTAKYGSDLAQASFMYSDKLLSTSVSVGHMQLTGTDMITPITPNNTDFLSFTTNYMLNKQFSVAAGQDFGMAAFGFCRYGASGGVVFRPVKAPVTLRMNLRFNDYKLNEGESWKQLYSGNIDITYRFKSKVKDDR